MEDKNRNLATRPPLQPLQISLIIAASLTFLGVVYLAVIMRGNLEISVYVRDPAATFSFTPLAGLVSHIGVFALSSAGVICIFVSLFAVQDKSLLFWAGLFSVIVATDDFFMLHENLLPRALGISDMHVYVAYGAFSLAIAIAYKPAISGNGHIGLYAALVLLGASAIYDQIARYSQLQVIIEDSLKFVGLMLWSTYWIRRAHIALRMAETLSPSLKAPMPRGQWASLGTSAQPLHVQPAETISRPDHK